MHLGQFQINLFPWSLTYRLGYGPISALYVAETPRIRPIFQNPLKIPVLISQHIRQANISGLITDLSRQIYFMNYWSEACEVYCHPLVAIL